MNEAPRFMPLHELSELLYELADKRIQEGDSYLADATECWADFAYDLADLENPPRDAFYNKVYSDKGVWFYFLIDWLHYCDLGSRDKEVVSIEALIDEIAKRFGLKRPREIELVRVARPVCVPGNPFSGRKHR